MDICNSYISTTSIGQVETNEINGLQQRRSDKRAPLWLKKNLKSANPSLTNFNHKGANFNYFNHKGARLLDVLWATVSTTNFWDI